MLEIPKTLSWRKALRRRFSRFLERHLPEKLYARTLIIMITPVVLLQSVIVFVFMERHWNKVTKHLSRAVVREISMVIDVYETYPHDARREVIIKMARDKLDLSISFLDDEKLPAPQSKPFFSMLDRRLSRELGLRIKRPFWIDTVGRSDLVDIRIQLDDAILRILALRNRAYATNSYIFVLWMVGSSLLLLTIAIIFLRNQIRPILRLSEAAESFGKGREPPEDFRPRGALEVQGAAIAFLQMRERIERQMEQRTAMLAGVSHDLRTILTRFNLQLALLGDTQEADEMRKHVQEMQHMLNEYLAFARGDEGEAAVRTNIGGMLEEIRKDAAKDGRQVNLSLGSALETMVKRNSFKRCVGNLVENAGHFAGRIDIGAERRQDMLEIIIDDDGPGISPEMREKVFRPFFRLDDARNQDVGGTGLGLAIARDIARNHGGDITLDDSPMGGLRAILKVPV